MIIDTTTQVWLNLDQLGSETAGRVRAGLAQRFEQLDAGQAAHEQAMGCLDGALVHGWRSNRLGAHIPNELVADFVARDPRRRIGVAGIDPLSPDSIGQLESAAGMGLVGVSVSPVCQGFHPAHSRAMRLFERCVEMSMPVFALNPQPIAASSDLTFGRPLLWDEVARAFPTLRLVIGHMGHPWVDETLVLVGKHPHVLTEVSGMASRPWQLYNALLGAQSLGVMDRILFGSGFPREMPAKAIEVMYSVNAFAQGTQLPSVPRSQIRGIVERDALALLGIDAEIAMRSRDDREPQRRAARTAMSDGGGNGLPADSGREP